MASQFFKINIFVLLIFILAFISLVISILFVVTYDDSGYFCLSGLGGFFINFFISLILFAVDAQKLTEIAVNEAKKKKEASILNSLIQKKQHEHNRYCVKCGRSIPFDANLCPYCGHNYKSQSTKRKRNISRFGSRLSGCS